MVTYRFHHADIALGHCPIDLGRIPELEFVGLLSRGQVGRLGWRRVRWDSARSSGWLALRLMSQSKPSFSMACTKGVCRYMSIGHQHIGKATSQLLHQLFEQRQAQQATSVSPSFWKRIPKGMGKALLTTVSEAEPMVILNLFA